MLKRAVVALGLVLWASAAIAQGIDVRFYMVPKVGAGVKGDPIRPKYVRDELGTGSFSWSQMDYGAEDSTLLAAQVTVAQHNILAAQVDVLAIPTPIDDPVGGAALATVQSKLEGLNIPGTWVTTSMSYRDVLRTAGKMMQIEQAYADMFGGGKLFTGGVTLDTRWNQLGAGVRNRLQQVADFFHLDTSGVTATMTLRQILRAVADQLPAFSMEGVNF